MPYVEIRNKGYFCVVITLKVIDETAESGSSSRYLERSSLTNAHLLLLYDLVANVIIFFKHGHQVSMTF